jgi:hypothetical protein
LPIASDGSLLDDGTAVAVVGELGDVAPGATAELELSLALGRHVVLSDRLQSDIGASDYALGMRAVFTVTDLPLVEGPVGSE